MIGRSAGTGAVEVLNEALGDIRPTRVRLHACWGNRDSPCPRRAGARGVAGLLQVKAGALCLPFANPRHSHEIEAFRTQKLPDRMVLACGVIETTHNYVEHPMVVAAAGARRARGRRP